MFLGCTLTLLFYMCPQLWRYLCLGCKLDHVSSVMILTNMNMNFKNWVWWAQDFKRWFLAHQNHDVCKCFSRSNPILCIRLSKILQACTSKRRDFKYKKSSRKVKNYAYNSMNFNSLSTGWLPIRFRNPDYFSKLTCPHASYQMGHNLSKFNSTCHRTPSSRCKSRQGLPLPPSSSSKSLE